LSNLAAVSFAYDRLSEADAAAVRHATARLRSVLVSTARLVVAAGTHLGRVRRRLKPYRGAWAAYLRAEVPWSRGQAYRLMRAARAFRCVADVDAFAPTALYVLTWPDAPPAAFREATRLAAGGTAVDAQTARRLVAEHRPAPPATNGDDGAETAEVKPPERVSPAAAGSAAGPDDADRAAWWAALDAVRGRFDALHVRWQNDGGGDDGVSVTAYPRDPAAAIRHFTRATLPAALLALLDREPVKRCPTCRTTKPVALFAADSSADDGLNRYCRSCARAFRAKQKASGEQTDAPKKKRQRPAV